MTFNQSARDRWVSELNRVNGGHLPTLPTAVVEELTRVLDGAVQAPTAPIAALLPTDWPRQVSELLDMISAPPTARDAAMSLVDSWVAAAVADETADRS